MVYPKWGNCYLYFSIGFFLDYLVIKTQKALRWKFMFLINIVVYSSLQNVVKRCFLDKCKAHILVNGNSCYNSAKIFFTIRLQVGKCDPLLLTDGETGLRLLTCLWTYLGAQSVVFTPLWRINSSPSPLISATKYQTLWLAATRAGRPASQLAGFLHLKGTLVCTTVQPMSWPTRVWGSPFDLTSSLRVPHWLS